MIKKYGSIEEILKNRFGINDFLDVEISYKEKNHNFQIDFEEASEICKEQLEEKFEIVKEETIEKKDDENKLDNVKKEKKINGSSVKVETKEQQMMDSDEDEEIEVKVKKQKKKESREIVPENWLFKGARKLFLEPNVIRNEIKESDLKFKDIDEEGLIQFLCVENGFSEERVRSGIKRIKDSKGKSSQTRIDSFFKNLPTTNKTAVPLQKTSNKRSSTGKPITSKRGKLN